MTAPSRALTPEEKQRNHYFMLQVFITKLAEVEALGSQLRQFDYDFVRDMRSKWQAREDAKSMGVAFEKLWDPTRAQMNYLESIRADYVTGARRK